MPNSPLPISLPVRQRGISLIVVLIFVMLSMLLALWASRTALFSEMIVGNDADHQRAMEAAQALLQDAELDIRGERADGTACVAGVGDPITVCRRGGTPRVPVEGPAVGPWLADMEIATTPCIHALCTKRGGRQDFWNNNVAANGITWAQMAATGVGARYGQYTGAERGAGSNPLLQWSNSDPPKSGGWYWIEVLPYAEVNDSLVANSPANRLTVTAEPMVAYRITAVVHGKKMRAPIGAEIGNQPITQVVLQQTYVRQKPMNP